MAVVTRTHAKEPGRRDRAWLIPRPSPLPAPARAPQRGPYCAQRLAARLGAQGCAAPEVCVMAGGWKRFRRELQAEDFELVEDYLE